jgi:hypothetical protein
MMWIDIGVSLLLILRIAMFRPTLPCLLDSKNDNLLLVDRDEEQERPLLGDGNIDEPSPLPGNADRNTGASAITYSCNPDLKGHR